MNSFQNKKRTGTFSENGPSSKKQRSHLSPVAPAAPAPQIPFIVQSSTIEIIEIMKDEIRQLKANLVKMEKRMGRVEDQIVPEYNSSRYDKWDSSPSYIN